MSEKVIQLLVKFVFKIIAYIVLCTCIVHYFGGWGLATFMSFSYWLPDHWFIKDK